MGGIVKLGFVAFGESVIGHLVVPNFEATGASSIGVVGRVLGEAGAGHVHSLEVNLPGENTRRPPYSGCVG